AILVEPPVKAENSVSRNGFVAASGLVFIVLGIVLQGALRDGITTWIPSYLSETFRLGSSVSILMTVALPLASIAAFQITTLLNERIFRNELASSALLFAVGFGALLFLSLFSSSSAFLSIVLASLVTGCMHGVNLLLVVILPKRLGRNGHISGISGLLNFFTYVGSAISAFGVARLTELSSWHVSMFIWAAAALLGAAVCLLCVKRWRTFSSQQDF
ncbi:MAG: hypothetical protein ABFC73_04005, partial [Clostridiaceae bacterium]